MTSMDEQPAGLLDEEAEQERIREVLERVRALRKYGPERELEVAADAARVSLEAVHRALQRRDHPPARREPAAGLSVPHSERLLWQRLPGMLPDAELTVLLSVEGAEGVWPGYWDGEGFFWADAMPVEGAVLGWADMPAGLEGLPE